MLEFLWILFQALLSCSPLLFCKLTHFQGFKDHLDADDSNIYMASKSLSFPNSRHNCVSKCLLDRSPLDVTQALLL